MIHLVTNTYLSKKIAEWMEVIAYNMYKQSQLLKSKVEELRSEMPELYHAITYKELRQLRNLSKLVPGTWYRIIDYVTKVANDPEARSAEHPFDLLVLATSNCSISEEARAVMTSRNAGAYFRKCTLDAWKVWYCIDNDTKRFMWASTTGTGVIYRLIDEWGNDLPYDFKNIQFKRYYTYDECGLHEDIEGTYSGINTSMYNLSIDDSDYIYCYSVSLGDRHDTPEDASLIGFNSSKIGQGYGEKGYFGDISIKPATCIQTIDDEINSCFCLNNVVLFVNNARYRALGSTHIDGECINMTLSCIHSTIGSDNRNIIMADRCFNFSIDQGCDALTFSQDCGSMSFSQDCRYMSFSQGCYEMSFSQGCSRINVDAGVHDICLPENASNIHIFAGVHGDRYQPLGVATGADYTQFVAMQSDGNIRIYNPADIA